MMAFMDKHEIDPKKVHSSGVKSTTKMSLISLARELGAYFTRVYPVSSSDQDIEVQVITRLSLVTSNSLLIGSVPGRQPHRAQAAQTREESAHRFPQCKLTITN